jgi:hypothetical protein
VDHPEKILKKASGKDFYLILAEGYKSSKLKWFSVWCKKSNADLGSVLFEKKRTTSSAVREYSRHLKPTIWSVCDIEKTTIVWNLDRKKITLKRLNILRRYVYSCVHAKAMPRWEEVLHQIDQAYMLEYAIADKAGVVHKVLQEWEL